MDARCLVVAVLALSGMSASGGPLVYNVGTGSQNGQWSPAFIESRFPVKERTQTLTREIRF